MGLFSALGSYTRRRLMRPQNDNLGSNIKEVGKEGLKAFKPAKIQKEDVLNGWNGKYEDGGVEKFAEIIEQQNLTPEDVQAREIVLRQGAYVYLGASALSLVGMIYWASSMSGMFSLLGIFGFMAMSLLFLMLSFRSDYSAWQIRKRRFAGIKYYINERFSK